MGSSRFVNNNIFVMKYYFFQFVHILYFIRISQIKIYTNVKTPKRKLESSVQRYSVLAQRFNLCMVRVGTTCTVHACTVHACTVCLVCATQCKVDPTRFMQNVAWQDLYKLYIKLYRLCEPCGISRNILTT